MFLLASLLKQTLRWYMRESDASRKRALLDLALPAIGAIALFGLTAAANAAAVPVTFAQAIESSSNSMRQRLRLQQQWRRQRR